MVVEVDESLSTKHDGYKETLILTDPTSTSTTTNSSTTNGSTPALPGMLAGLVRAAAVAAIGAAKGLLRWWFRVPVKHFRPYAINPWLVFHSLAHVQGTAFSIAFVRKTLSNKGLLFFGRNAIPLFVANAAVGATLFNVYSSVVGRLSPLSYCDSHSFIAGCVAGASQSLLATPLDAIQRVIHPQDLVDNHRFGVHRVAHQVLSDLLPPKLSDKARYLYRHLRFNALRDAGGFSLFFGVFEGTRKAGRYAVSRIFEDHSIGSIPDHSIKSIPDHSIKSIPDRSVMRMVSDGLATVIAGATAGAAYQTFTFPLDRLAEEVTATAKTRREPHAIQSAITTTSFTTMHSGTISSTHSKAKFDGKQPVLTFRVAWNLIRQNGGSHYFRGIKPQLLRAMPPSAAALFVYQLTEETLQI
ncbi:hypothetical protein BASA83_007997 [Batrachochytrium salamandrivorans]|nr:hypothetical protein BASA81_015324 [Batrachochytrium salamandrivorans]KAH9269849.1 hypothetical protein BASA83_007997 [Batrachochytrium salamandrivorans]